MVIMRQSTRSFVSALDFRTSPGHLGGAAASATLRREQGWGGSGPSVVVTDLAVYGFNSDGEMELRSIHPGATLDEVKSTIGWEIRTPTNVPETPSPTGEELRLIREELDPTGAYV
jgi:glutaconate CoA-transferase subunit B